MNVHNGLQQREPPAHDKHSTTNLTSKLMPVSTNEYSKPPIKDRWKKRSKSKKKSREQENCSKYKWALHSQKVVQSPQATHSLSPEIEINVVDIYKR